MDGPDDERTRLHLWTRVERGEQLDELAELCDRYAELADARGDRTVAAAARACAEEAERLLQDGYRDSELAALLDALPSEASRAAGDDGEAGGDAGTGAGADVDHDPAARLVAEQLAAVAARLRSRGERRLRPRRPVVEEAQAPRERRGRRQPVWLVAVAALTGVLVDRIAGTVVPAGTAGSLASFLVGFAAAALTFGLLARGRRRSGAGG